MKTLPPALKTHLESGATTLCWCWRLTRRDGTVLGFTDHDHDIAFEGMTFEADSGLSATQVRQSVGLNVDNLDVSGAVSSGRLNAQDLAAGRYDDARIEIFRVNWSDPDQRVLMRSGSLGEVARAGTAFTAEVRGLAHYLQQPTGRLFQYTCDADLGDARCAVNLDQASLRATGSIAQILSERRFVVSGLGAFQTGWFASGLLKFTTGENAGTGFEIRAHAVTAISVEIDLWRVPQRPVAAGDAFTVDAGCDKHLATCRDRFTNAANYRGFPHMPGNDLLTRFAGE